jgi:hypothetical protein
MSQGRSRAFGETGRRCYTVIRHLRWLAGLTAFLVASFVSCAALSAGKPEGATIIIGELPKSAENILDLPVARIDLVGMRMEVALRKIADAIYQSSSGKLVFSYGPRYAREAEFKREGIPVKKWTYRDSSVELHLVNTTLREVLNRLCAQSGWSYGMFGDGIGFIDDDRYSEAHKALVRSDQLTAGEIVGALEKYRSERGAYPNRLSDLVPKYIAAIKPPSYGAKRWEYVYYPNRNSFALRLPARKSYEESYWYNPLRHEFWPTAQQ